TALVDCDLTGAKRDHSIHSSPTIVDSQTILRSKDLPSEFLRQCGLQEWQIELAKLHRQPLDVNSATESFYRILELRARAPVLISNLFISYSHADTAFVDNLEPILANKQIPFWRDVHHATAGRWDKIIDRALRL